jgi:hypothetical protein
METADRIGQPEFLFEERCDGTQHVEEIAIEGQ